MSWAIVRPIGRFVYTRVALARHSGVFGGESGACSLPQSAATTVATDRDKGWNNLKLSQSVNPKQVVDMITRHREEVFEEWEGFTKQLTLVSAVWALGTILLVMRLIYGSIIGYGWGWQMFS